MFEGERKSGAQERKSLLSFSHGADEAGQDRSADLSAPDYVGDAQSRHRAARSRREARHNAMLEALAAEDKLVEEKTAVDFRRDTAPAPEPDAPDVAPQPLATAPTAKVGNASAAERLKDFVRSWIGPARQDAAEPQSMPVDEAPAFRHRDGVTSRRQDDRPFAELPPGGEVWTPLIDPLRVIGRVFDSKLLIVSTTLIGALIGVAIALQTPKKYEAITELLVDPRDLKLSERDLTEQGLPSDATLAIVENQARVLTSGSVLNKVVDRLNLDADPEFNGERKSFGVGAFIAELRSILSRGSDNEGGSDHRQMIAIENLARALTVQRGGKTFVITIGASTENPEKSALIANTMTEVFLETYGQIQSRAAGRAADELTARLDELRKGVEDAERKVAAFKAENDIIDPQGRPITDDEIIKLNEQLSTARARTLELNAKAASARGVDVDSILGGAIPESVNSNIVTELRSQYAALKNEADRMAVRLGPRHPERQAAEAQLAGARGQIEAELRRLAASIQVELKRAVELEQQLAQRLAQLKVRQGDLSGELVQLRELEREASTKRAVYEAYLLRARETGEQRDINTANMSVISKAYPPLDPSGPSRSAIALTGAFLGFASGVGFAMMQGAYESLRDRRRDARRRRPATPPKAPHPDGAGPGGPSGKGPRPGDPAVAFSQPPLARQDADIFARDDLDPDHEPASRGQARDMSPQEDSAMLTRSPDPYFTYGHEPTVHPAHQPGWSPHHMPAHPAPAYAESGPSYGAYPQPQMYPPPGMPYTQPDAYAAAGGYPQAVPPHAPAPAHAPAAYAHAHYAYAPQPDPRMQPAPWHGQPAAAYPQYPQAQGMPRPAQPYAPPAYPPRHAYAPPAMSQPPQQARAVAQPIPYGQAAGVARGASQALDEQASSSAIADIRASLAEFREAVREFTESRQKRRFF